MWALFNRTRFKAERTFVRDVDGAEIWLVAVRATFDIHPNGELAVSRNQQEVCRAPEFMGDPAHSSLRYDSDLVRTKEGTDVVLHCSAYPPDAQPTGYVDTAVSIGPLVKHLRVFGNRHWQQSNGTLQPSAPQPFTSCPIRYELAMGGQLPGSTNPYQLNPVGFGLTIEDGQPIPNIELPFDPILSPRYSYLPAGFGPIACQWQPRLQYAGTYDDNWMNNRKPLLPADFQNTYFRCAPLDQQLNGFLQGGEEVILQNLTPEGLLRFQLPQVTLGFTTLIGGGTTNHRPQLHTVIIEPEDRRLIMVWQTALPCHHTLYTLKQTTVFEKRHLSRTTAETA